MDLRDRDEPRQGVVANILNLFRNGAVGFIGWLSGWRDWSGRDAGFLRGIQRVLDQFPASILLAYHVATNYGRGPGVGRGLGVGERLQARSQRRVYWVQAVWIVNLFLYLVIAWWIFYRWRDQQPWNFYLFLFVLITPTVLYLASLLLCDSNLSEAAEVIQLDCSVQE